MRVAPGFRYGVVRRDLFTFGLMHVLWDQAAAMRVHASTTVLLGAIVVQEGCNRQKGATLAAYRNLHT